MHRAHIDALLREGARAHQELLSRLPAELAASLPVDAQGLTRAIDHLASAAGLSQDARRDLLRQHATNPAVMHARVFGRAPLARETVIGSFVEGARVRADALARLAASAGGEDLVRRVRKALVQHPPPLEAHGEEAVAALRATYRAQEEAALLIARALDEGEAAQRERGTDPPARW